MPSEAKRGCGYRKVGSLYLVGEGLAVVCDMLPLELIPCGCCGFEIPFTRNLMRLNKQFIVNETYKHYKEIQYENPSLGDFKCKCEHPKCPLCYPSENPQQYYGIMWVGEKYYTPDSFVKEAVKVGVSKKIPEIPKWLTLGETWVLLAHPKVPRHPVEQKNEMKMVEKKEEQEFMKAIFYTFKPKRIEMPIWKRDVTLENLEKLQKKGITPIIIEDGDLVHESKKERFVKTTRSILDSYGGPKHDKPLNTPLKKLLDEEA